jgi:hypothetical protein
MTYEDWVRTYKPNLNPLDDNASYDGTMFETYGPEHHYVTEQPNENTWTLIDEDGEMFIMEGYHWVNRMGYFITAVPHDQPLTVELDDG